MTQPTLRHGALPATTVALMAMVPMEALRREPIPARLWITIVMAMMGFWGVVATAIAWLLGWL
jgi:hypothetical protein